MTDRDAVLVEEPSAGVRLVTLNQPEIRNAMTERLTREWRRTFEDLGRDSDVRVVVVTGAGTAFCSGADLSFLDQAEVSNNTPARIRESMVPFYEAWLMPRRFPVPVIAAVNGPAIGAGLCLALACDLRYGSPTSVYSAPFISLGTHGGMGVTSLLPEVVGMARARELLFAGRQIDAETALAWGLLSELADDVVGRAVGVAQQIAMAAPIATRLTKSGLELAGRGLDAALRWEELAQPVTMATHDLHEGIQARRERRTPRFDGR